jgi:hypothetical protein
MLQKFDFDDILIKANPISKMCVVSVGPERSQTINMQPESILLSKHMQVSSL